ncbi:MAG TPA: hypothetical protein DCR24_00165, partial [Bacillus bacterium]|nr:hypothetical protein [Bacillus sp. (in: firmicutes)]
MRLIEIHIYGYGKLENYHISLMEGFQVFYGENEAGKSTIMSFIHSILFGFPAKQSQELRYEPKDNSKYGGKLKAFFPDKGIAIIERVKGKAAGDVTVSLDDGTIGGEELLKDLLQRMDKSIFQAIFSFNVHGLQNIQSMKGEELGKYLFSAGTLGSDKLFNTETFLIKEMDQRFKPSGKKPMLNEKLRELKEVQVSLKNAEQQNERYSQLVAEKESIEKQMGTLEAEIAELEMQAVKLKDFKRNEHLVVEEAGLRKRLDEYGPHSFPQDGLYRLEKLGQELKPIQARLLWIKEKRQTLMGEVGGCQTNADLLDLETEIVSRIENLPLYDQLKQEQRLLELKIEEITEDISQINDDLHTEFNEESIQEINTSVFMKDQAESIQHRQQRLQERKLELEADFEEEKAMLVELEENSSALKTEMLAEEQRIQLTRDLAVFENKEAIQSDLNQVKDQILSHKTRVKHEEIRRNSQRKKDLYQLLLLGSIFLILFFSGLMNSQWGIAGIGIFGVLLLTGLYYKSARESGSPIADDLLSELLEREKSLAELLDSQPAGNQFAVKSMLLKDDDVRQRHKELLVKIQQQSFRYEKVIQQFEKWETERADLKSSKAELIEQLGLKRA